MAANVSKIQTMTQIYIAKLMLVSALLRQLFKRETPRNILNSIQQFGSYFCFISYSLFTSVTPR